MVTVNAVTGFRVSPFDRLVPPEVAPSELDVLCRRVLSAVVESESLTLFSLAFGAGIASQLTSASARGEPLGGFSRTRGYFLRRFISLFVIGVLHMTLLFSGDILALYAILGVVAVPLIARLPPRALLVIAAAMFVLHASPLPYPTPFADAEALREHVELARHVQPYASYRQLLELRASEIGPMLALSLRASPRVFGAFLLGAALWRWRPFAVERRGAVAIVGAATFVVALAASPLAQPFGAFEEVRSLALAISYGSVIVVLHASGVGGRILSALTPIGRTTLTSYLSQSVILGVLFSGYGCGLMWGEAKTTLVAVVIFVAEVGVASAWLSRFRQGPVEWLWRWISYGVRPAFVRTSTE